MPRKPGLPKRRNTIAINFKQILDLIQRKSLPGRQFKSEEERRTAWKNNRSAILRLQGRRLEIEGYPMRRETWFNPFERPQAWFEYDMHENLTGHYDKATLFFIEATCCGVPYDAEIDQAPKNAVIYQNQKEYLITNGLLNATEKRLLKAENAK